MTFFKELVLLISPFIIIGGLVWFHVFGVADFLKWYRDRARESKIGDLDALREEVSSWGTNDYEPSDFIDEIDKADTIIEADTNS